MVKKFEKPKGKEHLDKKFLEELKHKIWSTKGSRFNADERLKTISKFSNLGLSFISAYLIIFGLLSVYNIYGVNKVNENILAFGITSLSILLLVFSLYENSRNYQVKANNFHNCGLELSELYNELQNFKSYKENVSEEEKYEFCMHLSEKYQKILLKYENHIPIDNEVFRLKHSSYYDIAFYEWLYIPIKYFFSTTFLYWLCILAPLIPLYYIIK